MRIERNHPLRRLFTDLVERRYRHDVHIRDARVAGYVAGLLAEFTHADNLYKVRNAQGQRLADVGELLTEADPLGPQGSFERERRVRKHIGDFTLFMTGLFPEHIGRRRARRAFPRVDALMESIETGRESYAIVSAFDQFEYREEAPLFRRLSQSFELCVYGLNLVKQDLQRFQQDCVRRLESQLDPGAVT
jgi:hypothetical protein